MDFKTALQKLRNDNKDYIEAGLVRSEEDTKRVLIVPFFEALGYDSRNPAEFRSEVSAPGNGLVDYVICRDDKPVIIIECKSVSTSRLTYDRAQRQLKQYFDATRPDVGVLTDGVRFQFFSDLNESAKMDSEPFLEIDLGDLEDEDFEEPGAPEINSLSVFTKSEFGPESWREPAIGMKYRSDIKNFMMRQLSGSDLDDSFVEMISRQVHKGVLTRSVRAKISGLAKDVVADLIKDLIKNVATNPEHDTTREELDGYFIVKNILWNVVDSEQVIMKDKKSYCTIQLDDSHRSRKRVCLLRFNNLDHMEISLFDGDAEEKLAIGTVGEINNYADRIRATASRIQDDER